MQKQEKKKPTKRELTAMSADTPVKLSSSLSEFLLSLREFMFAVLSDRRSQRGDSGNTPGMLRESNDNIHNINQHKSSLLSLLT